MKIELPINDCNGNRCDYWVSWGPHRRASGKICSDCELHWASKYRVKEFVFRVIWLKIFGPKADLELAKLFSDSWIDVRNVSIDYPEHWNPYGSH